MRDSNFHLSSFVSSVFNTSNEGVVLRLVRRKRVSGATLSSYLGAGAEGHVSRVLVSIGKALSRRRGTFLEVLVARCSSLGGRLTRVRADLRRSVTPFTLRIRRLGDVCKVDAATSYTVVTRVNVSVGPFGATRRVYS